MINVTNAIYFIGWLFSLLIIPHLVATTFIRFTVEMLAAGKIYTVRVSENAINETAGHLGGLIIPYWILIGIYTLFPLDFLGRFVFCYAVSFVLLFVQGILTIKEIYWPNPNRMIIKYTIDGIITGLAFGLIASTLSTGLYPNTIILIFAFGIGCLGVAKGIATAYGGK